MEYRGIQYQIVQTANPTGSVYIPGRRSKSGTANKRLLAIRHAETAIDNAIKVGPTKTPTKQ